MTDRPLIELTGVRVTWHSGRQALDLYRDLTLSFEEGQFYTIMGPSGSGKSTLLNLIAGFVLPEEGIVRIGDREPGRMTEKERCLYRNSCIGFIFQSFNLIYDYTVLENVMTPLLIAGVPFAAAKCTAEERLEQLGMGEKRRRFPAELSGGEQQRTAIARALVCDPPIILADEPTGNLDAENGQRVMEELKKLHQQGKTILLVTHDPEIGRAGSRQIQLADILSGSR